MSTIVVPEEPKADAIRKATLIVPVAGEGQRFVKAGYMKPKPYIEVPGWPGTSVCALSLACIPLDLIEMVVFVQRDSNPIVSQNGYLDLLPSRWRDAKREGSLRVNVVTEHGPKQGAAITVLAALEAVSMSPFTPVIVANCDQFVAGADWTPFREFLKESNWKTALFRNPPLEGGIDGVVMCFQPLERHQPLNRWSFPVLNKDGHVEYVVEKPQIVPATPPTVGIYAFRADLLKEGIKVMKTVGRKTNNEFYLAPTYSYMPRWGHVGVCMAMRMWGLGTPEDLVAFGNAPPEEKVVITMTEPT